MIVESGLAGRRVCTKIEQDFEGDTYFPEFDETGWSKELIMDHSIDEKNKYPFKVWRYFK